MRNLFFIKTLLLLFIFSTFLFTSCNDPDEQGMDPALAEVQRSDAEKANMRGKDMGSSIMRTFEAKLEPLNNSGVTGNAVITLDGNKLTVKIQAEGLEANKPHPQHIHGFIENNRNSTCPSPAADINNDGLIDLVEGLPSYGPVLLDLYIPIDEFPIATSDGRIDFERTFDLGEIAFEEEGRVISYKDLKPLQNRAIVLHGMTVDGTYWPVLPVACGMIMNTNEGMGK